MFAYFPMIEELNRILRLNARRFKNDSYLIECFACSQQVLKKLSLQPKQFTISTANAKLVKLDGHNRFRS